ncbi:hypothetical protein [Thermomonospora amylolytica]|uniref:hypothetical protein n=1 Tax=Thermomonospora amylolytica TaxID=1411117 RepID=UPI000E6BFD63|nr:hypothetical protein [Thermomonospora amylolytica]
MNESPDPVVKRRAKAVGFGCLGCLGLFVLMLIGGALMGDPKPRAGVAGRTAAPTATASRSAAPSPEVDDAARSMCADIVRVAELRRAGRSGAAAEALTEARIHAAASGVREVERLADGPEARFADAAAAWCRENLPEVTATPVGPTPTPSTTPTVTRSAAPEPEPEDGGPSLRTIKPGASCSPRGATGTYYGRTYTCKGPGRLRWRR